MKFLRHLALTLALLSPLPASLDAQAANYLPGVGAVSVSPGGGAVTLAIPGKAGAPYRVLWLSSPYRLVVDLQGHWLGAPKSSIWIGTGLVSQIRAARHGGAITRIVFDLTAPADVRADNQGGTLVLTVVPRGAVTGVVPPVAPAPFYAPTAPVPTRRPVPAYPAYPGYPPYGYPPPGYLPPVARVTPIPVLPPMGWVTPAPAPMPMQTPPPPMPMQTPAPFTPVPPPFTPDPNASAPVFEPIDIPVVSGPKPVFGNRFVLGGGAALSFAEAYPAGNSDLSVGLLPQGELAYDQLFTSNLGISLGARFQGYSFTDKVAKDAGVDVKHSRDEIEATLGIRGRFDLPGGLEALAQPQFVLRTANVKSTLTPAGGTATDLTTKDYLSVGYTGYGGGLGAGLGWRGTDWMSVAVPLEFNYVLGSMGDATVASIFPLMNLRAGLETRFDFGGFATTLGYKYTMYSNGSAGFNQSWHGPVLNLGVAY